MAGRVRVRMTAVSLVFPRTKELHERAVEEEKRSSHRRAKLPLTTPSTETSSSVTVFTTLERAISVL